MRVNAKAGDLVVDLLFKHTKQDDDQIEAEFYNLNPHVRGAVFSEDCSVFIPERTINQTVRNVVRSWS